MVISFTLAPSEEGVVVSSLGVVFESVVPPLHALSEHVRATTARKTARIRFLIADSPSAVPKEQRYNKITSSPIIKLSASL